MVSKDERQKAAERIVAKNARAAGMVKVTRGPDKGKWVMKGDKKEDE